MVTAQSGFSFSLATKELLALTLKFIEEEVLYGLFS